MTKGHWWDPRVGTSVHSISVLELTENGSVGGAERSGDVCGQSLYDAYYELYDAWIAAGYVKGQAADALLGQTRLRPSLIPTSAMGINPPSNRG